MKVIDSSKSSDHDGIPLNELLFFQHQIIQCTTYVHELQKFVAELKTALDDYNRNAANAHLLSQIFKRFNDIARYLYHLQQNLNEVVNSCASRTPQDITAGSSNSLDALVVVTTRAHEVELSIKNMLSYLSTMAIELSLQINYDRGQIKDPFQDSTTINSYANNTFFTPDSVAQAWVNGGVIDPHSIVGHNLAPQGVKFETVFHCRFWLCTRLQGHVEKTAGHVTTLEDTLNRLAKTLAARIEALSQDTSLELPRSSDLKATPHHPGIPACWTPPGYDPLPRKSANPGPALSIPHTQR